MLFQSLKFILFLVIIFLVYWKLPHKWRWGWLMAAGYFFYSMLNWKYSFLLLLITCVAFQVAKMIERAAAPKRKICLICYIVLVLGILCFYKYLDFFADIVKNVIGLMGVQMKSRILEIVLPVGISFYLFQTLGYVIDVYNGKIEAEKNFGYFATSVAFFPILLSGPIERIQNLTNQLKKEKEFVYEEGCAAVEQIMIGYFKKLIIADSLSVLVNKIYANLYEYQGFIFLIVIMCFSVQIYCDFSGYSDIAIGVARLFGIHVRQNFRQPYFADSIRDFWRRWHISLSSWFRDYVYIPLGGKRVSEWKRSRNLLITFLLSGLWHGAGWTFLVWGGLHGALQILENFWITLKEKYFGTVNIPKALRQFCVFVLISIAWVFFRADTLSDGWFVLAHSFDGILNLKDYLQLGISALGMPIMQMGMLLFFMVILFWHDVREEKGQRIKRYGIKLVVLSELALFYYLRYGIDSSTFIYFQF